MSKLNDISDYRKPVGSGDALKGVKHWRKVLYDSPDRRLGDNYTPHAYFLDAIERNKNLHKYSLAECLLCSCQVALQINFVLFLYVSYFAMETEMVTSLFLVGSAAAICVASYALLCYTTKAPTPDSGFRQSLKRVLIFVAFGLGLSPLFHRLTETIATDTIYTTSGVMLLVHLVVHDYDSSQMSALSLNAGLFASVCLASRLPTAFDGFALLSTSVEVFALLPALRKRLLAFSTKANIVVTLVISVVMIWACHGVVTPMTAVGAAIILFTITVLCPALFLHWQTYKDTIHGPWDEAIPKFKMTKVTKIE